MSSSIPVRNIYYLLSYAWNLVEHSADGGLSSDKFDHTSNLFAKLLELGAERILHRGLLKAYVETSEEIPGVRGKLEIASSLKSGSLWNGKAICTFDEHTIDNLPNQILKASIRVVLGASDLDDANVLPLRRLLSRLADVRDVQLRQDQFSKIKLNSHNRYYGFILKVCELICLNVAVSNEAHGQSFQRFLNDETQMHALFEKFLRRFYELNLSGEYKVVGERLQWQVESPDALFTDMVPQLHTDISIISPSSLTVIDAKFYEDALVRNYGASKFRRDHLSQIMDYLRLSNRRHSMVGSGLLIYPTVGYNLDNTGTIEGHQIRVATVNLAEPWSMIHERLLDLLKVTEQQSALSNPKVS